MSKLLHISASPRGDKSKSRALALAHIEKRVAADPTLKIDTLDLWDEPLPQFDGDWAAAKMTLFGEGEMTDDQRANWSHLTEITNRFIEADHYVFNVPMWNSGIPYRLKQYIDIITQPGMLYGFAPATGYSGLLMGKTATVIVSSAVWEPGIDPRFGQDFHARYLEWWLHKIGVKEARFIRFQPSMVTADPEAQFSAAMAQL
ncbi:FMN-dependent NADH-azoreductase [Stappia sp. BW2]|uniref:FMN-dependent NADH-azoreductase n=1 Tax=Stappia sp. BW2 TaxID=2592622 RepID=UPI0011DE9196|nr:NAD(P)H-dependent oxidoreductase [Stappia sp. BW2]TYC80130.1 FMN-dependent NADH-azoreductase [Stappia sp. BW2]